jgi:hypothetical protein
MESKDNKRDREGEHIGHPTSGMSTGISVTTSDGAPVSKRPNLGSKYTIKMLCDNAHAGPLVGKGGSNIKQLQEDSKAVIKISHSGNYFPGTDKRVVMVQSLDSVDVVVNAVRMIINSLVTVRHSFSINDDTSCRLYPTQCTTLSHTNTVRGSASSFYLHYIAYFDNTVPPNSRCSLSWTRPPS